MTTYYNEHDPKAAAWLRELIKQGHLPAGEVDERSIEDVCPIELSKFTQCHFFAGIGVWGYSLRKAGWPDDRPVWTGSCPCQPFSAAGKGTGFADERHLWPAWHHLISQCRPPVIFGEQVASKDGLGWLDLVQSDMEATDYAFGAFDLCAAGVGAPHIRQRLYFVADAMPAGRAEGRTRAGGGSAAGVSGSVKLADATIIGRVGWRSGEAGDQSSTVERPDGLRDVGGRADADGGNAGAERQQHGGQQRQQPQDGGTGELGHSNGAGQPSRDGFAIRDEPRSEQLAHSGVHSRPSPTNGFWETADWLYCTDGKWRPVEPGTFPLAYGSPARVGRLRGYGNAIVAPLAQAFIEEAMRCIDA